MTTTRKQLTGRVAEIVNGETELPLEKVNWYRAKHGLEPFDELPSRSMIIRTPKPIKQSKRCGTCGGGRPARKRPTLAQRAAKLLEATARHVADDLVPTPPEALAFRERQCGNCPLMENDECTVCGCYLQPNMLNQGKLRWRSESCPAGMWHRHNATYRPLVNPVRNLIFHLYPLKEAAWNWKWHVGKIREHAALFNGQIVIAVVTGANLAPVSEVQSLLDGIPVEWIIAENSKQAETATCVDLLRAVKTDDPNTITLRGHCKGVTHTRDDVAQPWARLLWETCTDIDAVQDALASHIFAGPLKSHEPLVRRKPGDWFFAGSWYWFRSDVFQRDWTHTEPNRWYVEYFPGHVAANYEAACLCHDYTSSSVLDWQYWNEGIAPDWILWKEARS